MRLAYTAMTRARIRVVWTATGAAIDEKDRRPSRFLLAASGLPSFDQIGAPAPEGDLRPLTPAQAQAWLRRTLTDPGAVTVERLAALTVLAAPPRDEWSAQWFSGARERGPDHGIVSPSIRLSPSQGEAYSKCPRRYALERRLGASDAFSPYAHFGSLIHQVLEGSERSALANSQPHADRATALAVLDQVWAAGADFGSPVLNEAWKGRGADLICRLYDKWPGGKAVVKDVERTLYLEIDGVPWSGRADRIESHALNQLRVVDYKTTTTQPSTSDAGRSLQLGFYVLAAANDPELMAMGKPTAAQFWHPMASGKQPIRSLDFDHLAEVVDVLKEIGERILNEDFPPTPGSHCRQCPVRLICPAWPEGREAYGA
jgi:RecB family exonuclease